MVGLNISLRFIFKPSYSPHCINTNVVCNSLAKMRFSILLGLTVMTSNLVGQDLKNPFHQDTITVMSDKCREEINQANSDFEKGLYVIELKKPIPFTDTQQKILFENYEIQTSYRVGLFSPNHDCYNFH